MKRPAAIRFRKKRKDDPVKTILQELRSLRRLSEDALEPLIDGYIEIQASKQTKRRFNSN